VTDVVYVEGSSATVELAHCHVHADCNQSRHKTQTRCTTRQLQLPPTQPPLTSGLTLHVIILTSRRLRCMQLRLLLFSYQTYWVKCIHIKQTYKALNA